MEFLFLYYITIIHIKVQFKYMADKNEWGSNLSFVFAMIGSAVGLGNIW